MKCTALQKLKFIAIRILHLILSGLERGILKLRTALPQRAAAVRKQIVGLETEARRLRPDLRIAGFDSQDVHEVSARQVGAFGDANLQKIRQRISELDEQCRIEKAIQEAVKTPAMKVDEALDELMGKALSVHVRNLVATKAQESSQKTAEDVPVPPKALHKQKQAKKAPKKTPKKVAKKK